MKIVITGGLGHIGSSFLTDARILDYEEVTVIDNLRTEKLCTLFNLPRKVRFVQDDVTTSTRLVEYFEGADVVVHMAGIVNAADTLDKDGLTREINYLGAIRTARAAKKAGVNKFIFLSTASVYGPWDGPSRDEKSENLFPQSPYAEYKLEAEQPILKMGIPHTYVLRFGTIFGYSPGMRFNTVTNKFLWNAVLGLPVTIWKPGTGMRPYLSLHHAKDALFSLIEYPVYNIKSGIYNIVTEHWSPIDIVNYLKDYVLSLRVKWVVPKILDQDGYTLLTNKAENGLLYYKSWSTAKTHLTEYFDHMTDGVLANLEGIN